MNQGRFIFYGLVTMKAGSFNFPEGDPETSGDPIKNPKLHYADLHGLHAYIPAQSKAWNPFFNAFTMDVSHQVMRFMSHGQVRTMRR